jgi:hypothetical protein
VASDRLRLGCSAVTIRQQQDNKEKLGKAGMIRIIKAILVLGVVGVVALAVFSYVADLAPEQVPVSHPVVLDVQ